VTAPANKHGDLLRATAPGVRRSDLSGLTLHALEADGVPGVVAHAVGRRPKGSGRLICSTGTGES
jgi:hypothetical protein